MGLQQQRSCATSDGVLDTQFDSITQQRAILQERSANWPHEFNSPRTSRLKRSRSPSPHENVHRRQPPHTSSYFTGGVHAHHIGLAGFSFERSEKQIDAELKQLYRLLAQCDKYQKYREKQPMMTVAEVIEKDAKDRAEREAREREAKLTGKKPPPKTNDAVWPEWLEQVFWRGKPILLSCHSYSKFLLYLISLCDMSTERTWYTP